MLVALLKKAESMGYHFRCHMDGVVDYDGPDIKLAKEALEACDVMHLSLHDPFRIHPPQWCLIVNGNSDEEQIADYVTGNWVDEMLSGP